MLKSLVSAIAFAALLTPAIADEYWVVLDPATQRCSVVEKKTQETATDTSEGTETDKSQEAATDTTEGTTMNNSQDAATPRIERTTTDTTEGATMDNSQEAATDTTAGAGTDRSQETAAEKTEATETDKSRGTTTNRQAEKITDTKDLLRLLAEAAESSKTPERVGSVYSTRAEAEYRMSIIRKCGIAR